MNFGHFKWDTDDRIMITIKRHVWDSQLIDSEQYFHVVVKVKAGISSEWIITCQRQLLHFCNLCVAD